MRKNLLRQQSDLFTNTLPVIALSQIIIYALEKAARSLLCKLCTFTLSFRFVLVGMWVAWCKGSTFADCPQSFFLIRRYCFAYRLPIYMAVITIFYTHYADFFTGTSKEIRGLKGLNKRSRQCSLTGLSGTGVYSGLSLRTGVYKVLNLKRRAI